MYVCLYVGHITDGKNESSTSSVGITPLITSNGLDHSNRLLSPCVALFCFFLCVERNRCGTVAFIYRYP